MNQETIDFDYFKKVKLKIGKVIQAEKVPKSKKLIKLVVDVGDEKRQIIAGLAPWYSPEEFIGKYIIVVSNLEPRKLMGLESQGMLLATCSEEGKKKRPVLLTVEDEVTPGASVC